MLKYAIMPRDEYISHIMYEACSGFGTDESLLIEVRKGALLDELLMARGRFRGGWLAVLNALDDSLGTV